MPRTLTLPLIALLVVQSVHQMVISLLGPVSIDLGLSASQLGLVFAVSSAAITLASPLWGLLLDAAGPRPVLVAGLGLGLFGLVGHAAAVTFAAGETLAPEVAFIFLLVFRGFLFGAGLAALPVVALAVAGTSAPGVTARTTAVGLVGAAQGLAGLLGPVVGGALVVASLQVPLYLAPVLVLLVLALVLATYKPGDRPHDVAPSRSWELLPAFGIGLLVNLSLGLVQVAALHRDAGPGAVEGVVLAGGAGLVLAQGLLVPLLKWSPARLMKAGTAIALAGYAVVAAVPSLMALAFLVVSIGAGFALTGFAATASLGVAPRHQGIVAGLVMMTSGLTFVAGPVLSTVLHEVGPVVPVIAAGAAAALAVALSFLPVAASPVPRTGPADLPH
ncbi:MFS transporter [Lentzea sp. CC55]|uniref:MFS transporter n=1 Tax=Lentzea sp. CC55 TaxID=2884909 RepID=UPI0027DF5025|nr:MFS transporter [Lentzea sp. CC55]MCG8924924.1 MFS transporter [Lentzea sp. CC55]